MNAAARAEATTISGTNSNVRTLQMQKQHQHQHRQRATDHDVLVDQSHRRVDVFRFRRRPGSVAVALPRSTSRFSSSTASRKSAMTSSTLAPVSRITLHGDRRVAESAHHAIGLFETELDVGNVAQRTPARRLGSPSICSLDLFGRAELTERADDVATFAFPEIARRGVLVLIAEDATNIVDRQLPGGQPLRIDDDLQFFFQTAQHVRVGDAGDAFQSCFDRVFGEPTHSRHVQVGRQQRARLPDDLWRRVAVAEAIASPGLLVAAISAASGSAKRRMLVREGSNLLRRSVAER